MTIKQQELCNIIETLPEEFLDKVIDYIEYLKFSSVINNAPDDLIIKSKEDLKEKLQKGIDDTKANRVHSLDEVFAEIDNI